MSAQTDAMLAGTKRVFHFRAHYLIYWLLADKDKGLKDITDDRAAFALAQLLYASKSPVCVVGGGVGGGRGCRGRPLKHPPQRLVLTLALYTHTRSRTHAHAHAHAHAHRPPHASQRL